MAIYDVICLECEKVEQVEMPMKDLDQIPRCACGGKRQVTFIKPTVFHIGEMSGVIWSEKQIESSHGVRWRETSGSSTEGGCGKVQYHYRRPVAR
jgi:hypothetical protein